MFNERKRMKSELKINDKNFIKNIIGRLYLNIKFFEYL